MLDLRVECFMLADAAQNAGGKLYILGGGWDVINTAQFPLQLAQVSLVVKLAVPWSAANRQHEFRVDLDDEDGGTVLPQPLVGTFSVARPPTGVAGDDLNYPDCHDDRAPGAAPAGPLRLSAERRGR